MNAIAFDHIPSTLRVPGVYVEINNELANASAFESKVLLIGQRLATGSVAEAVPTRVTSSEEGEAMCGRGSMLAEMIKAFKAANPFTETWLISLDDAGAGVAATGDITFGGAVTATGTLNLYIGGQRVQVAVASGEANSVTATNVAAAITAATDLPVTAAVNGVDDTQVDLTARNDGTHGNDIDLRVNYYTGEVLPAGLTVTFVAMSNGATNPDVATAIAAIGDEWYN